MDCELNRELLIFVVLNLVKIGSSLIMFKWCAIRDWKRKFGQVYNMINIASLTYSVGNKTFGVPRCFVFISQYASICGPIVERYECSRADLLLDCNGIKTLNGFVDQNPLYTFLSTNILLWSIALEKREIENNNEILSKEGNN